MGFFKVVLKPRTYLNLLYLLLSFPLGLFYFVVLVTGISLGLGLLITLVGIPLLMLMVLVWWGLAFIERHLAISLLRADIAPMHTRLYGNLWHKYKQIFKNPVTWKSLLFLFLKFPMGIFAFVVVITLISVSMSFIIAPLLYILVLFGMPGNYYMVGNISLLDNPIIPIILGLFGIFLGFVSLHAFNGIAFVNEILAEALLGSKANIDKVPIVKKANAPKKKKPVKRAKKKA